MLNMAGEHGQTASGHVERDHKRGQPAGHVWTRPVLTRSCSGHIEVTFGPCCNPAPDVTIVASNVAWNITCGAVTLQRGQAAGQVQTWPLHNCTKKCEKLWFLKKIGKTVLCKTPQLKTLPNKTRICLFIITVTLIPFWTLCIVSIRIAVWRWAPKNCGGGLQRAKEVGSKELTFGVPCAERSVGDSSAEPPERCNDPNPSPTRKENRRTKYDTIHNGKCHSVHLSDNWAQMCLARDVPGSDRAT